MAVSRTPKIALLLRLLAAIDEGRYGFEALKVRIDEERAPSTRTLRRYLATLAEAGFPWYFDRQSGAYRFEHGYSLRRLEFSGNELFGLLALKGIATSLGGKIGSSIDDVTDKLAHVADRGTNAAAARPTVRVQLPDAQLDPERAAIFELLQKAQRERQSVRFAYVDKAARRSRRHVDPYGFVVSGGRVYAVVHDRGRGATRVFALDAISEAQTAPQRFTMPDDFDLEAFAAGSVSGIMHADSSMLVTVRYSPVVARAAQADRVVRERTIDEREDGSVEITYTISDAGEFVRWAMKWGAEAEIIAPAAVRESAAALARAILARYEPRAGTAQKS
jgi:predicted DNA-binding transcriptional regulator YafY